VEQVTQNGCCEVGLI